MRKDNATRASGNGKALPKAKQAHPAPSQNEPVILGEITRNEREEIRLCLSRYQGGMTLDLRVWFREGEAILPTRTGIAIGVRHLHEIDMAIKEAMRIAKAEGLLDGRETGR